MSAGTCGTRVWDGMVACGKPYPCPDHGKEPRDLSGRTVEAGDLVAYAAPLGRSPVLKYGIVTRTVGEGCPFRVITVDPYGFEDGRRTWTLQKGGGEVALGFGDRLLVLREDQVEPEARRLLRAALAARRAS